MTQINAVGVQPQVQSDYQLESVNTWQLADEDPNLASQVDSVKASTQDRLDDLATQIANTNDPQLKMELEQEEMEVERAFTAFKESVEDFCKVQGGGLVHKFTEDINELVSDLRSTVTDSFTEFGTATVPADIETQIPNSCPVDSSDFLPGDDAYIDKAADDAADDVAGASEGDGESKVDIDEMVNLLQNDPDAFTEAMQDVDANDRMAVMAGIQEQVQQVNQLFSMMTQFSQAMHDTSKAVIQNLRV